MSDATQATQNDLQACLLIYDIPEDSGVGNPSNRLRRIAVRVNLSCWIVLKRDVPYHLLNEMTEDADGNPTGVTWHVIDFAAHEAEKLQGMVANALNAQARETAAAARRSAARSAVNSDLGSLEDGERHRRRVQAASRRAMTAYNAYEEAAGRFGVEITNLSSMYNAVQAVHAATRAKAAAYTNLASRVGEIDAALAAAARGDECPAGILTDFLMDHGEDVSAELELIGEDRGIT